jgi:hypothetical protein
MSLREWDVILYSYAKWNAHSGPWLIAVGGGGHIMYQIGVFIV